jgi:hypothetical protein
MLWSEEEHRRCLWPIDLNLESLNYGVNLEINALLPAQGYLSGEIST